MSSVWQRYERIPGVRAPLRRGQEGPWCPGSCSGWQPSLTRHLSGEQGQACGHPGLCCVPPEQEAVAADMDSPAGRVSRRPAKALGLSQLSPHGLCLKSCPAQRPTPQLPLRGTQGSGGAVEWGRGDFPAAQRGCVSPEPSPMADMPLATRMRDSLLLGAASRQAGWLPLLRRSWDPRAGPVT